MKTLTNIILIAGCLVLFTTCKKYTEGGYINKGDNYIEGTWTLTLYEVNGIDSTELINYNNDTYYYKWTGLHKNKPKDRDLYGTVGGLSGGCVISQDNKTLNLYYAGKYNHAAKAMENNKWYRLYYEPEGGSNHVWKIIKFTEKELVISLTGINNYKIKLNK